MSTFYECGESRVNRSNGEQLGFSAGNAQNVGKGALDTQVVEGFRAIWDGLKKYADDSRCGDALAREVGAWEGCIEVFVRLMESDVN